MSKPIYKFYDLEHLTQEDLNKLALERNTLHQENKQLKEELQKADSITQSCIFEGKEESTINFRECLNKLELYKEVIEEVREFTGSEEMYNCSFEEETNKLLQILDKAKEDK